jgi:glycosyltransferase involved in cell wall biosynthesis
MSDLKSKVLYLSYDGLTDPLGQSQVLPYLLGLSRKGFRITVVSFEKSNTFIREKNKIENLLANKIAWSPLLYHKNPPVVSTLLDIFVLWITVKRLHKKNSFRIIHCRSYITSLVGLHAKRHYGMKFIFDMRGFWADERVEGGLWNLKNPLFRIIYNFFKKKEKEFLKEADQVVSLTHNARNEIQSWDIESGPITVIPTCVDLDLFDPAKVKKQDQNALRKKLGLKESDFILLYLGSWGTWYLTNEMLNFFALLKRQKPEAKFLIVSTDNINLKNFQYKADVIITYATRENVPLHISLANASVFFIRPSFSKKASSATKMGEILAMEIPIYSNVGWGDIEFLNQIFDGVQLTTFNAEKVEEQTGVIRTQIEDQFSLEKGVELYGQAYSRLLA